MAERTPVVAANWKMHKTIEDVESFLAEFLTRSASLTATEVFLCPPYLALERAVELCARSRVRIAAQNMHEQPQGAYTGEVSAPMLREIGVDGVILGHSERRSYYCESDAALARKVSYALEEGLQPILCVGERDEERDAGRTEHVLRDQLVADLAGVTDAELAGVTIAYEPVWAIGTGRTATPDQAEEAIRFIRSLIADRSAAAAAAIRIVYGGSVNAGNARELLGRAEIDGALVGGASLDPSTFAEIAAVAAP